MINRRLEFKFLLTVFLKNWYDTKTPESCFSEKVFRLRLYQQARKLMQHRDMAKQSFNYLSLNLRFTPFVKPF